MNTQKEFLNGLITPLGYGYIESDELVQMCLDNGINFAEFKQSADSLEDFEIQTVAQAYVNMDKDKDAKDFLTTVGMLD